MISPPKWFTLIEQLRERLLLTKGSMAKVLGVTRASYYGWEAGKAPREAMVVKMNSRVDKLLVIMKEGWPTPRAKGLEQKARLEHLLDLLN